MHVSWEIWIVENSQIFTQHWEHVPCSRAAILFHCGAFTSLKISLCYDYGTTLLNNNNTRDIFIGFLLECCWWGISQEEEKEEEGERTGRRFRITCFKLKTVRQQMMVMAPSPGVFSWIVSIVEELTRRGVSLPSLWIHPSSLSNPVLNAAHVKFNGFLPGFFKGRMKHLKSVYSNAIWLE